MAPHVIIVGGGFGGLSAARSLRNAPVRVTLIDKRNYHLFGDRVCSADDREITLTRRRRVRVLSEEPPSAQNLIDPAA